MVNSNPKYIIVNFEKTLINAAEKVFSSAKKFNCLFHFVQSNCRWIQNKRLVAEYKTNKNFKISIKLFLNLAFVPTQDLNRYYKAILNWIGENGVQNLSGFISYFEYTYFSIYDNNENIEQKCIFSASSWNAYERVLKKYN